MSTTRKDENAARWSRREFLGQGVAGAVMAGVAVGAGTGVGNAGAAGKLPGEENPWRYDVDALRRVDPALLRFEKVAGFPLGLESVRRLALGKDGEVLIAAGRSVVRFSAEGRRVGVIEVGDLVRSVRMDASGAVFVGLRDRVEIWDLAGRRTARWPVIPGKPYVTGFAFSEAEVFVADAGNRVVYRCDRSGRIQLRIGEKSAERRVPGLVLPSPFLDVEMGVDGLLRVNNPGRHKVEVYTRDGELEQSWGRPGVAIDGFCGCCNPIQLAALPDGLWVTAEKGLPRVKVFAGDGTLDSVVAAPDSFAAVASEDRGLKTTTDTVLDGLDVAVDGEGRVWVLDLVGGTVQVFRRRDGGTRAV